MNLFPWTVPWEGLVVAPGLPDRLPSSVRGCQQSLLWFGALSIRSRRMLVARPASSVCVRWVVSSASKLQVRPAALPLDLGDGALAVLLAPGLNASS